MSCEMSDDIYTSETEPDVPGVQFDSLNDDLQMYSSLKVPAEFGEDSTKFCSPDSSMYDSVLVSGRNSPTLAELNACGAEDSEFGELSSAVKSRGGVPTRSPCVDSYEQQQRLKSLTVILNNMLCTESSNPPQQLIAGRPAARATVDVSSDASRASGNGDVRTNGDAPKAANAYRTNVSANQHHQVCSLNTEQSSCAKRIADEPLSPPSKGKSLPAKRRRCNTDGWLNWSHIFWLLFGLELLNSRFGLLSQMDADRGPIYYCFLSFLDLRLSSCKDSVEGTVIKWNTVS